MSRCTQQDFVKGEITSADEIKNIPVDTTDVKQGSVLTYEGGKIVFKEGGSGVNSFIKLEDTPNSYTGAKHKVVSVNTDETGLEFVDVSSDIPKQEVLDSIKQGNNITIDRGVLGEITINSTGGGAGVDKFTLLTDTPNSYVGQQNKSVVVNNSGTGLVFGEIPLKKQEVLNSILEGSNITIDRTSAGNIIINSKGGGTQEQPIKVYKTNTTTLLGVRDLNNIIIYEDLTNKETQEIPEVVPDSIVWRFINNSNYDVIVKIEGKKQPLTTVKPNTLTILVRTGGQYVVAYTIPNLSDILTSKSSITNLSDVPVYSTVQDNSVLTKVGSGLEWVVPSGTVVDTFLQLKDTPTNYTGAKYKGVRVNKDESGLEFIDILGGIIAGKNITIDKGTDGDITINSTGGGTGGFPYEVKTGVLKTGAEGTPFIIKQVGGSSYFKISPSENPIYCKLYSNGDLDVIGDFYVDALPELQNYTSEVLNDAIKVSIFLPLPPEIEDTKEYKRQLVGISLVNNPIGNLYNANTSIVSATNETLGKYVLLSLAFDCFGVNQAYYKALYNKKYFNISFRATAIATDKGAK